MPVPARLTGVVLTGDFGGGLGTFVQINSVEVTLRCLQRFTPGVQTSERRDGHDDSETVERNQLFGPTTMMPSALCAFAGGAPGPHRGRTGRGRRHLRDRLGAGCHRPGAGARVPWVRRPSWRFCSRCLLVVAPVIVGALTVSLVVSLLVGAGVGALATLLLDLLVVRPLVRSTIRERLAAPEVATSLREAGLMAYAGEGLSEAIAVALIAAGTGRWPRRGRPGERGSRPVPVAVRARRYRGERGRLQGPGPGLAPGTAGRPSGPLCCAGTRGNSSPVWVRLLPGAGNREHVAHPVVALVARVLERLLAVVLLVRFIANVHGRVHVCGSLSVTDHSTVSGRDGLKRSIIFRFSLLSPCDMAIRRSEVRRLDDERVAFPVAAARRPCTCGCVRRVRAAVERDDARFVNHLVADRHVARALHDLVRVAVDGRHHRAGHAAGDAAIVEAEVLVLLNGPLPKLLPPGRRGRRCALGGRGGTRPSAGSTTSHARLFLAPKFSNQWTGLVPGMTPSRRPLFEIASRRSSWTRPVPRR